MLVVEDNRDLNSFLTDALARDYRVASARDGAEGLALARSLRPSVILTDMMMPRLGGDELLRAVQADPELQHIPVVVLTAKGDDDLRLRLLRAGAQDYILKPFSLEEVRARIGNLVSMKLARDVLRHELRSNAQDLSTLAREVTLRQRELKTALDSLTVARDQALHASEAKTAFLSMVSHELRTPLTTLRLQIDRLQAQAHQKSLTLQSKAARDLPAVTTDKEVLRLILVNLIANAIKFTQQGSVTVGLDIEAQLASISVTDTGPGIAPDEQVRIFEPFEQVEQVRHKHTPGVGLGLALVREMVQALGGQVRVQSSVGEGSTFIVTILVEPRSAANFED